VGRQISLIATHYGLDGPGIESKLLLDNFVWRICHWISWKSHSRFGLDSRSRTDGCSIHIRRFYFVKM